MDIELTRLAAAARRINASITPTRTDDGSVFLDERDVAALTQALNTGSAGQVQSNEARGYLHPRGQRSGQVTLDGAAVRRLSVILDQFAYAVERDRKIRRGIYPGPMSGSEAVKFWRGTHGIR